MASIKLKPTAANPSTGTVTFSTGPDGGYRTITLNRFLFDSLDHAHARAIELAEQGKWDTTEADW